MAGHAPDALHKRDPLFALANANERDALPCFGWDAPEKREWIHNAKE